MQEANRFLILAQNFLMLTHLLLHYWNIKPSWYHS